MARHNSSLGCVAEGIRQRQARLPQAPTLQNKVCVDYVCDSGVSPGFPDFAVS
jgi:hypothetical protein